MVTERINSNYELTRVSDANEFARKLRVKRLLWRLVGEIYIGRRVKLGYFRDWLKLLALPADAKVLEVGSGDGVFAFFTAGIMAGATVVGLELNRVEASECQKVAHREGRANLSFVPGLLEDQQWDDCFDLIYCLDVLEHIADDVGALRQMLAVLKPGGSLLIHVPNRFYMETDGTLKTVADEDAWQINPGHVRNGYTPAELEAKITQAGFDFQEVKQTQGKPIALAFHCYRRIERWLPARIALLPLIDLLTFLDRRRSIPHGNTVWAHAKKTK